MKYELKLIFLGVRTHAFVQTIASAQSDHLARRPIYTQWRIPGGLILRDHGYHRKITFINGGWGVTCESPVHKYLCPNNLTRHLYKAVKNNNKMR